MTNPSEKCTVIEQESDVGLHLHQERIEKFESMAKKAMGQKISAEDRIKTIEKAVVEELNKEYAVIHTDQFYILREKPHPLYKGKTFILESKQSLLNTFENQIPEGHTKSKAKIWLAHPERRQFNGLTFDPTTIEHKNGLFNIWNGFAVEPREGSCALFKAHVKEVICAGNYEHFTYVWNWMARLVQKPDEIATGLVLMGSQGTGKGKFVTTLGKLFGKHFLHLDNIERLLGNFNFHMKDAVLVFGDEAIWGGNRKDVGKLKAMVTEKTCMIEPKGKDPIAFKNFRHFILASNEDWPVHLDPDDRRFLVLRVSEARKEDFSYFKAIDEELEKGGFEALLYELFHEDISYFNPRDLPKNEEAFDIKMKSLDSDTEYLYEVLCAGAFDPGGESYPTSPWKEKMPVEFLYN